MIIGHFSGIAFSEFVGSLAPAAIVGLLINFSILSFGFRDVLRAAVIAREPCVIPKLDRGLFALTCIVYCGDLRLFFRGIKPGVDSACGGGAGDGAGAPRHPRGS